MNNLFLNFVNFIVKLTGKIAIFGFRSINKNMIVSGIISSIKKITPKKWTKVPPELMTIPILSGYQVYENYNKADQVQKNKVLTRDLTVLGFTCAGILGTAVLAGKIFSKSTGNLKDNIAKIVGVPLGGVIGGLTAGTVADKFFPIQYPNIEEKVQEKLEEKLEESTSADKKNSESDSKKENKKNILNIAMTCLGALGGNILGNKIIAKKQISFLPGMFLNFGTIAAGGVAGFFASKPLENNKNKFKTPENIDLEVLFSSSYTVVKGVDIAQAKGAQDRIKKGFYEIIAGVIVPTALIFPVAQLISTKKVSKFKENAIMVPLTIASVYLGRLVGDFVNKKVSEKVIDKQIYNKIQDIRQNLILTSFLHNDKKIRAKASADLEKIIKIEKTLEEEMESEKH
ncbi:MAG: DUF2951 family protein [Candidatus Gastranaerophilales bacterium]|nr:DUF2951 family protein [Candidatus Gastranaerophilales bacterium]